MSILKVVDDTHILKLNTKNDMTYVVEEGKRFEEAKLTFDSSCYCRDRNGVFVAKIGMRDQKWMVTNSIFDEEFKAFDLTSNGLYSLEVLVAKKWLEENQFTIIDSFE